MVHLRNCQARLHSKRDARCNLEVARNEAFCPAHNAEYQALAVRGRAAAGDVQDLNTSIDALLARDVATYTTDEAVQRDIGDLERYLQVLDDRVETRMMLSRRFFTERGCPSRVCSMSPQLDGLWGGRSGASCDRGVERTRPKEDRCRKPAAEDSRARSCDRRRTEKSRRQVPGSDIDAGWAGERATDGGDTAGRAEV
ncbi:hypothetical protein C8T65DRAFT_64169 [Cerioporus squamosus]|nr:hypothetical protein C8T65DRAFT_64169 [Cerioporus squamosus]